MLSRLRHRLPLPFRLLLLAVLLLGTAGGSLAAALGDLHALSHSDHPAAPHAATADDHDDGHNDEDAGTRLLHGLVHCGHCHGQGGMLPFASPNWQLPAAPAHAVPAGLQSAPRRPPPENLLRPPITA
jgi:mono/diheme cytochrome c family protein